MGKREMLLEDTELDREFDEAVIKARFVARKRLSEIFFLYISKRLDLMRLSFTNWGHHSLKVFSRAMVEAKCEAEDKLGEAFAVYITNELAVVEKLFLEKYRRESMIREGVFHG